MFYVGQPIRTIFKDKYVTAHIVKKPSHEYFVLRWEIGKKNKKEKYNRLFSQKELEELISGKEVLKVKNYDDWLKFFYQLK